MQTQRPRLRPRTEPQSEIQTGGRNERAVHLAAFGAAIALGALLHASQRAEPFLSPDTLVVLAAVALLLRPTSLRRVVLLFAAFTGELLGSLPGGFNHTQLLGVLGLATIGWWLAGSRDLEAARTDVLPGIRTAFLLVWAAAALAKWNTGFLDLAQSCALWMMDRIPGLWLPEAAEPLVVWGTLAIEIAVPVCLLVPRLRVTGVALGWLFHLGAAIAGHTAFSGLAWSIYLLFLAPATVTAAVRTTEHRFAGLVARARPLVASPWAYPVVTTAALTTIAIVRSLPTPFDHRVSRFGPALVYTVWAVLWAWALWRVRRSGAGLQPTRDRLLTRSPWYATAAVVLVLVASAPYVGLRTISSFTMYSNIRTEPGHWNHLVVPETARVFDWQDDVVRVLGVDGVALEAERELAEPDILGPTLAVRRWLEDGERARVVGASPGVEPGVLVRGRLTLPQLAFGGFRPMPSVPRCQV